ncbi:MAG: helix-turn-helix domain-containing protein [Candidatus Aminicenantes bacterium]|nr:MAG: helix-turn-helix domain-containing protein [Candidatus Aminicenantes bacterium]
MKRRLKAGLIRLLAGGIIIVQLFCCQVFGLDPNKTVDQYLVDQWEMTDGFPSNTVISIAQTPDGYLWIATFKGLVRFGGMKFSIISFAEKEKMTPLETIHPDTLFVDRGGTLWIGHPGGITSYDYRKRRFKTFTPADGITGDRIRRIKEDMRGNLWISFHASYVNRFSNGTFTVFNESHGLEGKKINDIVEDRKGNLLFGTSENGVFRYKDGKFLKYPVQGLNNLRINTMHEDRRGDLWIGTNHGLFRITDKSTAKYTAGDGLSDNYITGILEDSERNLWVGADKGLNRIIKKRDGTVGFESLLKPFRILCLFEDKEGNLWLGTLNAGIKRLKDRDFISYAPLETHQQEILVSMFEDGQGDTWIGTVSGKLFRCRGSDFIETIEPANLSNIGISAVAEDAKGNLWVGTSGRGVFQKKNGTFVQFTTRDGLADNQVTSIYRDSRHNLWFSTFDGVSVVRHSNGVIESFKDRDGLSGKKVHNVYEDKNQNIWIAADKGITVLTDGRITKQNAVFYLKGVNVTCIYEDPTPPGDEGRVYWAATHGAGLKRFSLKDRNVITYTTDHGMTTNFIYQFFEDRQGKFWLMSNSGILRVDKNELNRFANGETGKINCTSFGISDGMKSIEFNNEFSRHSALKAGNGEFWFITRKGISIVNPGKILINKQPPPVLIEEVFFDQRSIPLHMDAGAYVFKDVTNFSFHFTAPTFLSPEKTIFKYRLEGVDADQQEWIFLNPGQQRAAHYRNLSPGTYTFRVTACNAEGVWNRTGDSVTFTLKSFFYQTPVFKIAVLLLFIALVGAAFYIYKKKKPLFEKKAKYKGAPLDPSFAEEWMTKLKYLMEIEKVYCDADITLQSLAGKMSIASHQLSQLLNEKLDRSFFDYINSYRIEEAKKILQSPRGAQRKISSVAIEVGFNTMAAFYKAFKKHTGTTPTRYKKK